MEVFALTVGGDAKESLHMFNSLAGFGGIVFTLVIES
jgi:hypothetical protein